MLYLCICVFVSQTPENIVFENLVSLPFQKYSTCHVYLQLWPMLYLYICVFVFVHLQVRYPGILFLRSWYHYLLENICFLLLHNWENLRCHACDGHTHTHVKLVQYSAEAESAIDVWNCFHFRQLRPWVHDNYCCLKIKSDAGQHLQCFSIGSLPLWNSTWIGFFIWNSCNCNCKKTVSERIFYLNKLLWKKNLFR